MKLKFHKKIHSRMEEFAKSVLKNFPPANTVLIKKSAQSLNANKSAKGGIFFHGASGILPIFGIFMPTPTGEASGVSVPGSGGWPIPIISGSIGKRIGIITESI